MKNNITATKHTSKPPANDWRMETLRPFVKKFQHTPKPVSSEIDDEQKRDILDTTQAEEKPS